MHFIRKIKYLVSRSTLSTRPRKIQNEYYIEILDLLKKFRLINC